MRLNQVSISNCNVRSHDGNAYGGAIDVREGSLAIDSSTFANNTVWANLKASSGAIRVDGGSFWLRRSVLDHNGIIHANRAVDEADSATVFAYRASSTSQVSHVSDCQFSSSFAPPFFSKAYTVVAYTPVTWGCLPGQYMPTVGAFNGDFTSCRFACAAGYYGTTIDSRVSTCSGPCPADHYCLKGTVNPVHCPTNTFSELGHGTSIISCLVARVGTRAQVVAQGISAGLHKSATGGPAQTTINVTITIEGNLPSSSSWRILQPDVPWLPQVVGCGSWVVGSG
jgi:hypothetical protein